ncbi:autotransporter outer membrane beta-barrel domain-containing protein [Paraburkholderia diazotrophica]|uniref:autotransporter outer membrane beta-barrel domain-containing protein n=1 Tax=Paraburkholderia diazotrophica TaxID=667676 RepID=UPI003182AE7E
MNRSFRTIWNDSLGAWVAASEIDHAKGGRVVSARESVCNVIRRTVRPTRAALCVSLSMTVRAAMLLLATTFTAASAQTLSWGPSGGGGSGTWDNTTANWFNGATAMPWVGGNTAAFGGTAGTVTVSGTMTVGGLTFGTSGYTITGGTLATSGGTLTITGANNNINANIGSTIAGGSNLAVLGGFVTLTTPSAMSYTGSTTVANGATLNFSTSSLNTTIQSTAFYVNGASTLITSPQQRENINGTITFDQVGGGTVNFAGSGAQGGTVLSNGSSSTSLRIVATGGAQDSVISSTGTGLNLGAVASSSPPSALILDTTTASSSLLVSAPLWNQGASVTKTGPGTATITAANTYAAPTIIDGGVLSVSNLANGGVASNIGASTNAAANLVINGGTLRYTGTGASTDRAFTLGPNGGAIDASGAGRLNFTNTGAIAYSGTGPSTLTLTGSNAAANTFALTLGDNGGSSSLVKAGAGTWVLTGNNTYTGGTFLNGGTLSVANDGNLGAASGTLTFDGGTLENTAAFTTSRNGTLNGGGGTFQTDANLTVSGAMGGAGALTKTGGATLTVTGNNTYGGGTTISAGTLQIGNGGTTGSIIGNVTDNGTMVFDRSDTYTFAGVISGSGVVNQIGGGTTVLTGNSGYTGGTTISAGTLQLGNGGTSGSITGNVVDNATLAFDRSDTYTFGGVVSGSGALNQTGGGTTILRGANSYTGATNVASGTLIVDGNQSAAAGLTSVQGGGAIGGTGTIGGSVVIANGAALNPGDPGSVPGTLTMNGDLTLNSGSVLNYNFGQANVAGGALNDLTDVGGNLTLAGTLNVQTTPGATFSPGVYRVINYNGTLTNNGLAIGAIPSSSFYVQTSVANQVNLVNTGTLTLRYWDGAAGPRNDGIIEGGNGVWQNSSGNDFWTEQTGTVNAPFTDGAFAIFEGAPGTVTVDNSLGQVQASGMQFATNGYHLSGGPIELTGGPSGSIVRVGDGTTAGTGYTVTIDNALTGSTQLVKTDLGTLVLNGSNTYTGGTDIQGGAVRISSDANLGASTGGLTLDGGTLETTANMTSARNVSLASTGTFMTDAGTTLTLAGPLSGPGSMTKAGSGSLVLVGDATHTGGTTITAGTLQIGNGATTGSLAGDVANNATLAFDRSDTYTFGGAISGSGVVNQTGSGTTVLTGNNTYLGGTSITNGTLSVSSDANLGATSGAVTLDGGTLETTSSMTGTHNILLAGPGTVQTDPGTTLTLEGTVTGSGSVTKAGAGTLLLAGADAQTGDTVVAAGTLKAAAANVLSPASAMTVQGGATLDLNGFDQTIPTLTNAGTVALSGAPGTTLTVSGNYTGAGGVLRLNTLLNQGGPATSTDMLTIGGNAGGNTGIRINGSGGGAQTTGDGIRVVHVGGTSSATAFQLAAPVQAGAYQYLLYRGGSTDANDWYLRSQLEAQSTSDSSGTVIAPAYRPAVTGYVLTPSLNLDYGFSVLGTLHERVGDIAALEGTQPGHSDGVWGRVSGQNIDMNANHRFSSDAKTFFAQFGKDWTLARPEAGGSTHAGVMATFGTSSASFADSARGVNPTLSTSTGTLTSQAQSFGGYWTRYFADHAYVDAVAQLTHYHNKYGDAYGVNATQNGFGAAGSLEVGKPWLLGPTTIAIEPQAQLQYQYLHQNDFNDSVSPVSGNTSNTLRGRLGFRLFRANLENDSRTSAATPYLTVNVLHDFFAPGATTVGSTAFAMEPAKTWYELGAGVTASLGRASELYMNVSYTGNLGGEYRRTIFGQAGFRYSW